MKQVSYEFDIRQITRALVCYCPEIEDGHYRWMLCSESVTDSVPRIFVEQRPEMLPGHIVRITGLKIVALPPNSIPAQQDDSFFLVQNREVLFYDDVRITSRPEISDEGLGEDS